MKFAHLADLHLGYRQYGLYERALDFNKAFTEAVDTILDKGFSFVLISGDVFHYRLPPAMAVRRAFHEFSRLQKAGIPVIVSRGNHDASIGERGGNYLHLLADRGSVTYLEGEDCFTDLEVDGKRIRIVGVGCYPESQIKNEIEKTRKDIDPQADYNVIMFHQTLDKIPVKDKSWPFYSAYFFEDLFRHVNYYALGHIHTHNIKHPDLPAYYPGSIESWDLDDAETHIFDMQTGDCQIRPQQTKGFLAVNLDHKPPEINSFPVTTRKMVHLLFRYRDIDPKEANDEIARILPKFNMHGGGFSGSFFGRYCAS